MNRCFIDYYRCPEEYSRFLRRKAQPVAEGYFSFGADATCYGHFSGGTPAADPAGHLHNASDDVVIEGGNAFLPFDPDEVVENFRRELYVGDWRTGGVSFLANLYYFLRPVLRVGLRRRLQQIHLRGWDELSFPRWPVDSSVDDIFGSLMLLALRTSGAQRIPFIWFWPEGHASCAMMTHDVEATSGRDFCSTLMDIDDSRNIKSSFQIVPEERYDVSEEFLSSVRDRGFEVAVHDLNHDGHLYRNRAQFLQRAEKINVYLQQYQAQGFRAGVLYRRQAWYDALKCSYDMSVPNVARLDPQRGGCCTVMPYFVGDILELPVTMIQDYTLFYILNDYSLDVWRRQADLIMRNHGLMSFIVHPDYVMAARQRSIYESLLDFLAEIRTREGVWITTPGEVNRWWRQRAELRLVKDAEGWRIEGAGKERARIGWASEAEGRVVVEVEPLRRISVPAQPGLDGEKISPRAGMLPNYER